MTETPGRHHQHRAIQLLGNGQLHQSQSRPPTAQNTLRDSQADHDRCQASGETGASSIYRDRTVVVRRLLPNLALWDQGDIAPLRSRAINV